jgi:Tol biopolymer transport system component
MVIPSQNCHRFISSFYHSVFDRETDKPAGYDKRPGIKEGAFPLACRDLPIVHRAGIMQGMNRRWLIVGMVFVVLAGLAIFARANLPALTEVSPADGATQVAADQALILTFSETMQPESVTSRLEIQPPTRGDFVWEANTLTFTPATSWARGEQITVTLQAGARSSLGLPMLKDQVWSFGISPPRLVYLWPSDGPADLYSLDLINGTSERLTETANGVLSYSVSTDSRTIFYSTRLDVHNSAIFGLLMDTGSTDTILSCTEVLCNFPAISPDGRSLAFTRAPSNPQDEPFPQQVWLLPIEGGTPISESQAALMSEPAHESGAPFWSPTGILTFYDSGSQVFVALNPATSERIRFSNETGEVGTWAPDGSNFIVHEIDFWGSGPLDYTSHLWRFAYPSAQATDLSVDLTLEDATPVYDPNGQRIAFGRKYLDKDRWIPGRQLWIMSIDGSNPRQITDDPDYNHADFAWYPNGEFLAFVRYQQTTLIEPPEIWIIYPDGTGAARLMIGGYAPQWIP